MLCTGCGQSIGDNHKFCEHCGTPVPQTPPPEREPYPVSVWAPFDSEPMPAVPAPVEPAPVAPTPAEPAPVASPLVEPAPVTFVSVTENVRTASPAFDRPPQAFQPEMPPPEERFYEQAPAQEPSLPPERFYEENPVSVPSVSYRETTGRIPTVSFPDMSEYKRPDALEAAQDLPVTGDAQPDAKKNPESRSAGLVMKVQENPRPLSLAQFWLMELVGLIPLVNIVVFLVISLRGKGNPNRVHLAQAKLLTTMLVMIAMLAGALTVAILISLDVIPPITFDWHWFS